MERDHNGPERIRSVHFIGVGGVGMSGIARVAHDLGMRVSGSDIKESRYTKQLRVAGVEIRIGHSPSNIFGTGSDDGPDIVVVSTAILDNNPELASARERGLTIWHRAQMLARLGDGLETLAVAGTHGKTTTSSMLASVLDALGEDPTFLIGGIVRAYGTNARSGTGRYYAVEADESDKARSTRSSRRSSPPSPTTASRWCAATTRRCSTWRGGRAAASSPTASIPPATS